MLTPGHYGVCNLSVVPVRSEASDRSEMVTQLLFGDFVKVLEFAEPWIRIRFERDHYEGWMDFKQLNYLTEEQYDEGVNTRHLVLGEPILELEGPKGIQNLMLGSNLPFLKDGRMKIGTETYIVLEPVDFYAKPDLFEIAEIYINTPYLWGGKSIFGIDCSGLVQNIFKVCGTDLPRDAWQQEQVGEMISFGDRQAGDLAFFTNAEGKVHHVGILSSPGEIIHAAGRVRKDRFDEKGIFNTDLGKQTHQLHCIKRIMR